MDVWRAAMDVQRAAVCVWNAAMCVRPEAMQGKHVAALAMHTRAKSLTVASLLWVEMARGMGVGTELDVELHEVLYYELNWKRLGFCRERQRVRGSSISRAG